MSKDWAFHAVNKLVNCISSKIVSVLLCTKIRKRLLARPHLQLEVAFRLSLIFLYNKYFNIFVSLYFILGQTQQELIIPYHQEKIGLCRILHVK